MRRYFFDLVGKERSEYDYSGRELPTPESAHQLAELIALDLALEEQEPWYGWSVNVRNAEGCEMFCVPVESGYLAAA
jgi:hypothetical protein